MKRLMKSFYRKLSIRYSDPKIKKKTEHCLEFETEKNVGGFCSHEAVKLKMEIIDFKQ